MDHTSRLIGIRPLTKTEDNKHMPDAAIKSMKLYTQVERIHNDLASKGIGATDALTVDDLSPFDQYHYFGTQAVDEAIAAADISSKSRVLDVGSGLGGPARYLTHRSGCHVTAVELQSDLNETATQLTKRCGLSDKVNHVCGNILSTPLESEHYDAVVSWLALYHIPDRAPLFPRLHDALASRGKLYVEDLYQRSPFTAPERADLESMLYGQTLPERDQYIEEVSDAGFDNVDFGDMTDQWSAFTSARLKAFHEGREAYVNVHGEAVYEGLNAFYTTVAGLFEGGHLGGVRLTARKN